MAGCWESFTNIVKKICTCCKPVIEKVIEVGAKLLEEKLNDELSKHNIDDGIKQAIKDSAQTFINGGAVVTEQALNDWTKQHVESTIKLVASHEKNSTVPFVDFQVHDNVIQTNLAGQQHNEINLDLQN
ncbi:hypothetical protein Trichorick_00009 [Candidatus Trichorickettsia mobilis]|uniref:Uncharacterized protein n=1 Tax=Candidatus Trichorickettsia mobilis TaxID=1346319 RepID=A0ABZ0UQ05_9RICK|nr:hypothetical protein [Candidatus Trichorickettsia mobilis]WPY00139.1 hypothetical protein Trichorick_00009 [Candidatus Trichorickettsia mobilis]